ncbi:MAG: hypothetical protein E6G93_01535 [Alphaproteobacteria bacterium]|nr:MAG: hypothetical protein E6G93_01535 [Alphaproteobacteria bacterium]TMK43738.1 MAG: hypothetical protein E6G70_21165 [Alphaproteobacteria bacterium]
MNRSAVARDHHGCEEWRPLTKKGWSMNSSVDDASVVATFFAIAMAGMVVAIVSVKIVVEHFARRNDVLHGGYIKDREKNR